MFASLLAAAAAAAPPPPPPTAAAARLLAGCWLLCLQHFLLWAYLRLCYLHPFGEVCHHCCGGFSTDVESASCASSCHFYTTLQFTVTAGLHCFCLSCLPGSCLTAAVYGTVCCLHILGCIPCATRTEFLVYLAVRWEVENCPSQQGRHWQSLLLQPQVFAPFWLGKR
jgi:hypothetical protein